MNIALAVVLMLASAGAAALGLGQIEVKSRIGQPLLAEIPIISNDPEELEQLSAGLASPDTFARIGLPPPSGIVTGLRFAPALDAAGRPIIRVTSALPVTEPLLTFLVQVDWGQGRLVREYSALVDTPRTVSALVQPPIDAPVIDRPGVIERPAPVGIAPPAPAPVAVAPPPAAAAAVPEPRRAEPSVRSNAIATAVPRPEVAAPMAAAIGSASGASQYGPVKAGESLSQIIGSLDVPGGVSLEHSMIALLRANPNAFIGGNINQLKQGAVLRVPLPAETAEVDARQAMALVRAQARQWRQSRVAATPPAAAGAGLVARPATVARPPVAPAGGARLEIVPPGASLATRAGTQSGISAGGEGQMLRQQLQQTTESLAARDAELRELKGRVADLEKLQADQQQLLALKDSELAAAQQRLAASNQAAAAPAAAPRTESQTTTGADTAVPPPVQLAILPWVLGGFGVLMLALLGAWLLRRRPASKPKFVAPAPMSAASLADAFAPAAAKSAAAKSTGRAATVSEPAVSEPASSTTPPLAGFGHGADVRAAAPPASTASGPADPSPAAADEASAVWNRRERQQLPTGRPELSAAPAWHGGGGKSRTVETPAAVAVQTPVAERLELAQAYLDLGDHDSARQLLGEVADNGDAASRQQASRMLRELE